MRYKVLVVDDSTFFRRRVTDFLQQDKTLTVVGQARNGLDAIEQVKALKPDVITMDVEMPLMNGIDAVKRIMAEQPTPILMFSSLTHKGAKATLDALDAGALDFIPKKFEDIAKEKAEAISLLQQRVKAIASRRVFAKKRSVRESVLTSTSPIAKKPVVPVTEPAKGQIRTKSGKKYSALAIGSSTGGPVALQTILTKLPMDFPYPIFLVQHMPGTFTSAFAARLNSVCQIAVKEAENGELVTPGTAYLAPGGKQMLFDGNARSCRLKVTDAPASDRVTYKPSVDLSFASMSNVYQGDVLGIILTGMGADGREGCRVLKEKGAQIWAQDENTCVVYGMPQAVANAGIATVSLALNDFSSSILTEM